MNQPTCYNNKKDFIARAHELLERNCCRQDCDDLIDELNYTRNKCHTVFGKYHSVNEKGEISDQDTICNLIDQKIRKISNQFVPKNPRRGGKTKKKKNKRRKTRKYRRTKFCKLLKK